MTTVVSVMKLVLNFSYSFIVFCFFIPIVNFFHMIDFAMMILFF